MIKLSVAAAKEIARIQKSQDKLDSALRLEVKQGGCSGLFYCLKLEQSSTFQPESSKDSEADDCSCESQGIAILVGENSRLYVEELHIDYAEDLMGGGFRFHNPQAISSCSCGISFTPKED